MKAMLLAAGKGTRMGELTQDTPKPLLPVRGRPLIAYQLDALGRAGYERVVVNTARFGDRIEAELGDGAGFNLRIHYSPEGEEPLDTGGGILAALPLLGAGPFTVANADVYTDFDYTRLPAEPEALAHLVLAPNPAHNPGGDFALAGSRVQLSGAESYTYTGIGVLRPELFAEARPGRFPLAPLLRHAASQGLVSGEIHRGRWLDVGTPERLRQLERWIAARP